MFVKSNAIRLKRVLMCRLHIWRLSSRVCQLKIWLAVLPQVLLWGFLYVQSEAKRKFLPAAGREKLPIYLTFVAAARIFCLEAEGVKCGVKGSSSTSASGHEAELSNNSSHSLFFIPVKALGWLCMFKASGAALEAEDIPCFRFNVVLQQQKHLEGGKTRV